VRGHINSTTSKHIVEFDLNFGRQNHTVFRLYPKLTFLSTFKIAGNGVITPIESSQPPPRLFLQQNRTVFAVFGRFTVV